MVNMDSVLQLITGTFVLLMVITITLLAIFSIIEKNATLATESTNAMGLKATGLFHVSVGKSSSDRVLGRRSLSSLGSDIDTSQRNHDIDEPGFSNDNLFINVEDLNTGDSVNIEDTINPMRISVYDIDSRKFSKIWIYEDTSTSSPNPSGGGMPARPGG